MDLRRLWVPVVAYGAGRASVLTATWLADLASPQHTFFDLAKSWDGGWYYQLALTGYPRELPVVAGEAAQSTLGFFPLFPMAARLLATLPGLGPLAAAVVISLLGGLVATILVGLLGEAIWDRDTGERSAVLFAFFPGSFVFSLAYSEGLALALAAACLLALHRQRWLLAGLAAALATATRPNALALVPAAAVAALLAIRSHRRWAALVAPALAPLGFVAFHVFLRLHTGRWDAYLRTQEEGWSQNVSLLATPRLIGRFLDQPLADANVTVYVVGTLLGLGALVALARCRPPPALLVYSAAILFLSMTSDALGPSPRFLLTAFPLLYGVARAVQGHGFSIVVGGQAAVLGALTFVTMTTLLVTP